MAWVRMAWELYTRGEYDGIGVVGGIVCELKAVMCIIGFFIESGYGDIIDGAEGMDGIDCIGGIMCCIIGCSIMECVGV